MTRSPGCDPAQLTVSPDDLVPHLPAYLARQRWFGAKERVLTDVAVGDLEALAAGPPGLVRCFADAGFADGGRARYHVLLGLRPSSDPTFTASDDDAIATVDTPDGPVLAYDAVADPELCLVLLGLAAPAEAATTVRRLGAEQSNSSVVYDDRLILKVFRHLRPGPNPDVATVQALAATGFDRTPGPVGVWRQAGYDLAFVQRFLPGGAEGWQLAVDSVNAGGDFSADAAAVGAVTARLHQAMATAFGVEAADPGRWADELEAELASTPHPHLQAPAATRLVRSLRTIENPGPAMRIHGDYHLGQVMRTPDGWFVLDFEGEPARPVEERLRPSSPLRDVAGMLRSFQYASMVASVPADGDDHEAAPPAASGREWEVRAREAFLSAYLASADHALLPAAASDRITLLNAFELQKAAYEVRYEQSHRPQWGYIPLEAISRLVPAG